MSLGDWFRAQGSAVEYNGVVVFRCLVIAGAVGFGGDGGGGGNDDGEKW